MPDTRALPCPKCGDDLEYLVEHDSDGDADTPFGTRHFTTAFVLWEPAGEACTTTCGCSHTAAEIDALEVVATREAVEGGYAGDD